MNKVPSSLENPFDVVLLRFTAHLLPLLHATNHTPNVITTYSLICGLASVYFLSHGRPWLFAGLYAASYVFDCLDGQYARKYKMTSAFGDLYDHATDIVVYLLICVVVYRQKRHLIDGPVLVLLLTAALGLLSNAGCQQTIYRHRARGDPAPETLDSLRSLCPCDEWVNVSKYFGYGTFNVLLIVLILYLYTRSPAPDPHRRRQARPATADAVPRRDRR